MKTRKEIMKLMDEQIEKFAKLACDLKIKKILFFVDSSILLHFLEEFYSFIFLFFFTLKRKQSVFALSN